VAVLHKEKLEAILTKFLVLAMQLKRRKRSLERIPVEKGCNMERFIIYALGAFLTLHLVCSLHDSLLAISEISETLKKIEQHLNPGVNDE
jgi:hypothetical protein